MSENLFENIITFPDPDAQASYNALVGLDAVKEQLAKEAQSILRPDLLEKWSHDKHNDRLPVLDLLLQRPPLFIFGGDVGTGKTALASTFGDNLARETGVKIEFYCLSLRARGSGAVGEMTRLISDAFHVLHQRCPKPQNTGKKGNGALILLIDEADSLAQSREFAQMHHEDRAGVNSLIRGIDDIAMHRLPCLVVMCTNRLDALDPAVRRRAAATFEFVRPNIDQRRVLLDRYLSGTTLGKSDIDAISAALGEASGRPYGFTFSDITQRFLPTLVLSAYPDRKVSRQLALDVAKSLIPTPPFKAQ